MLSSRYRFHGYGSLRYLIKHGKTSRNRILALRYSKNPHRKDSRAAVVVGKKVSKSAVKRNRIRRRIFEILRQHWTNIEPSHDLSIAVFSIDPLTMSHEELERSVIALLKNATIYTK